MAGKAEAGNLRPRGWDECCCRESTCTRTFPRQLGETLVVEQPFYDIGSVCKVSVNANGIVCGRIFDGR